MRKFYIFNKTIHFTIKMVGYKLDKIIHINAEVTRACNLNCNYCFNDSGIMMFDELKLEEWELIIDTSKTHGVKSMLFTGGEVMMRKDSPEIIGYALEQGLKAAILSNGLKLDSQYKDMIQKLERVQISMDSASPYSHDARCGEGSWKIARKAIDYIRGLDVPMEISTTISADHIDELEGIAGIAYLTGSSLLIRPMQSMGRALEFTKQDLNSTIAKSKQRLEDKFGNIFVEDFAHYVPVLGANHDQEMLSKGYITILPNGKIRGTRQNILSLEKVA